MLCLIEDELLYYYILEFSGYKEKIQLSCVNKKNNEIIYIRYSVIMRLIWFNNLYRYVRTKDVISNFTFRSYELQSSFLRNYQKNLRDMLKVPRITNNTIQFLIILKIKNILITEKNPFILCILLNLLRELIMGYNCQNINVEFVRRRKLLPLYYFGALKSIHKGQIYWNDIKNHYWLFYVMTIADINPFY